MENTEKISQDVKCFILNQAKARADRLSISHKESWGEETSLIDSGLFDSFSFMSLLAEIEKKFSIELDLSEYEPDHFTKIDGLVSIAVSLMQRH